jgi:hypothetical protein
VLTARRLATPLSDLAIAAEHLGAGGDVPLLRPKGPHELQITIGAFNRMHERLRRFNATACICWPRCRTISAPR